MKYIITLVLGVILGWYLCSHFNKLKHSVEKKREAIVSSVVTSVVSEMANGSLESVGKGVDKFGKKMLDDSFENVRNARIKIDTNKVIELSELGE
jgi:hypothetical protein